ncbi:hypothetical protein A2773_05665 [Candidatus Gottesmanbacteria bacterium RIFCSPHIGHO2_01_FULL_39_10]|uniref:Uncharacterized protein n=1 Tax=Candidatus Gottesmanbacteria bacterium RIFCSPHIGHO2_01_FULL_39_10 TaxID=1798375 RepID=A0A1F5ZMT8_9BACT|nr:MAG: hypothetical protein A2773_05665 [Candidatus Gottesmanbacteria bacterium RIFCSPHIGHO2_01_FULL_39_10]
MTAILKSLFVIALVAGLTVGATSAFFSDEEKSTGNVFTAGAIDLQIDNTSYLNRVLNQGTTWGLSDLTNQLFFNFIDLKPGDEGEDTISLHVNNNDAWACVDIDITKNDDVSSTEPELEDNDTPDDTNNTSDGELAQNLNFIFWTDDGDNVLETGEQVLTQGPASNILNGVTYTLADSQSNNVGGSVGTGLIGGQTYYIGKAWCFGTLSQSPVTPDNNSPNNNSPTVDPGIDCDGSGLDNTTQTDTLMGDITFTAVQKRNNTGFLCNT